MSKIVIVDRAGEPDTELLHAACTELGLAQATQIATPAHPSPAEAEHGIAVDGSTLDQIRVRIESWLGDQGYSSCRVLVETAA